MFKHNKAVWGWALYDWGNSAFATTVMAGFFPIFFKQYWSSGGDVNMSTAQLGLANSVASLLVALMAPVLGAIADRGSYKKRFMTLFAYLGVLMTACLFLVEQGNWLMAVLVYTLGTIGFPEPTSSMILSCLPCPMKKRWIPSPAWDTQWVTSEVESFFC